MPHPDIQVDDDLVLRILVTNSGVERTFLADDVVSANDVITRLAPRLGHDDCVVYSADGFRAAGSISRDGNL